MARVYKQLTSGISSRPIRAMVESINTAWPLSKAEGILDVGCGPGSVLLCIIDKYGASIPPSCPLTATDFSAPMIEQVKNVQKDEVAKNPESPWNRVEASVMNAMDLNSIADNSVSHVTAGWVYFMTPDPQKCLTESLRVLKPDGVLSCSSWKGNQWIEIMGLVSKVRPDKVFPTLPEKWSDVNLVKVELETAEFRDVEASEVGVEVTFEAYEIFLDLISDKVPQLQVLLKDLSKDERETVRELMMSRLKELAPTLPGTLTGTAVVARGRK